MNITKLKSAAHVQVIDMNNYPETAGGPVIGDPITADEFIEEYLGLPDGSISAPAKISEAFQAYMDVVRENSNYPVLVCTIVNGQIEVVTA